MDKKSKTLTFHIMRWARRYTVPEGPSPNARMLEALGPLHSEQQKMHDVQLEFLEPSHASVRIEDPKGTLKDNCGWWGGACIQYFGAWL